MLATANSSLGFKDCFIQKLSGERVNAEADPRFLAVSPRMT